MCRLLKLLSREGATAMPEFHGEDGEGGGDSKHLKIRVNHTILFRKQLMLK